MNEHIHHRWTTTFKVLSVVGLAGWCGALGIVMAVARTRATPQPELGRIVPWEQHGGYVYFTAAEDLALRSVMWGSMALLLVVAFAHQKLRR